MVLLFLALGGVRLGSGLKKALRDEKGNLIKWYPVGLVQLQSKSRVVY